MRFAEFHKWGTLERSRTGLFVWKVDGKIFRDSVTLLKLGDFRTCFGTADWVNDLPAVRNVDSPYSF